jgi:hypothetical protein
MESLGYLAAVEARGTSPLCPKIYRITGRGRRRLREGLQKHHGSGSPAYVDRWRGDGSSAEHLLHEVLMTEVMLQFDLTVQQRADLELLSMQRRSLERHPAFLFDAGVGSCRLKPDGMFLYRQQERGLMCCFVELDNGTESGKQLRAKFARYAGWVVSAACEAYLRDLYQRHGARQPQAVFRVIVVARGLHLRPVAQATVNTLSPMRNSPRPKQQTAG